MIVSVGDHGVKGLENMPFDWYQVYIRVNDYRGARPPVD